MDAPGVAFIMFHGHLNFGHSKEKCMHCYDLKKKGYVPPFIQHSKECPFNKFIFEEPVIEDGISIVYFYGKNKRKKLCKLLCVLWKNLKTEK